MRAEETTSTSTPSFDSEKVLKDLQEKVRVPMIQSVSGRLDGSLANLFIYFYLGTVVM